MTAERMRLLEDRLRAALASSPAVLVHRPRQVGKPPLARHFVAEGYPDLTLEEPALLDAARSDPAGFVDQGGGRLFIDEIQRAPELFRAIKMAIDRDRRPGRFLLTGSANALFLPRLAEALVGRLSVLNLLPMTQSEIYGTEPEFIERLLRADFPLRKSTRLGLDLAERIVRGGFPPAALAPTMTRTASWLRDYSELLIRRDLLEMSRVRDVSLVERLLAHLAVNTSNLWKSASYAAPLGLDRTTIKRHLDHLRAIFLIDAVPAWSSNETRRLVKSPKLHLVDSGLCCALRGIDAQRLHAERTKLGPILETFVVQEVRRLLTAREDPIRLHHLRDRDGAEIDLVLERSNGEVAAIEVKAGATVRSDDFRMLRRLRDDLGDRFLCGVVLHDGEMSLPFGDRLFAVPFGWLWSTPAS